MRALIALPVLLAAGGSAAPSQAPAFELVAGSVPLDRGPDGNSILLDAPEGLILVDTGRHPDHAARLIARAEARRRPVAAIVNTHWHLDHTTGNAELRQAFPRAHLYATPAVEGALASFLRDERQAGERALADPATSPDRRAAILRALAVLTRPDLLRPTRPVTASGRQRIGGRTLELHVAPFAATEADLWLFDPKTRTLIAGDLVVGLVPFMDTACPDGWSRALDAIAAKPFRVLIPGHGEPMTRPHFLEWREAFRNLLSCGRSTAAEAACVSGWMRDAARFIPGDRQDYVRQAGAYYLRTRLRGPERERLRYCRPLGSSAS